MEMCARRARSRTKAPGVSSTFQFTFGTLLVVVAFPPFLPFSPEQYGALIMHLLISAKRESYATVSFQIYRAKQNIPLSDVSL